MSVPVRYSATLAEADDSSSLGACSVDAEMREPWIKSKEGRLGTPGAAAADISTTTNQQSKHNQPDPINHDGALSLEDLFVKLQEALSLECKFQPNLYLPHESQAGDITVSARDGAAHVLRCLKVWYDLPTDVLFTAVNLVDRFLAKMKVRPKHMACISVGSFHLAIQQLKLNPIDPEDLVAISQCRCTAGDLERMAGIIANKLGVQPEVAPITSLTFLRLYYNIFRIVAKQLDLFDFYEQAVKLQDLEMRLEILACDANCAGIRPSELALVLICTQMTLFRHDGCTCTRPNQDAIPTINV